MKLTTSDKLETIMIKTEFNTKKIIAFELGISRPTLDSRIKGKTKWGKLEEYWINFNYNKLFSNR